MDIGSAFAYAFKDKKWVNKLGVFVIVLIVPVLNLAGVGYHLEILRRVMKGSSKPLPDWDGFGRKFLDGLLIFFASVVYMLPVIVLACLPLGFTLVPAFLSGNRSSQVLANVMGTTGTGLFAGLGCLFILYALGLSIIYPAVYIQYAQENKLGACFKLREVFAIISRNSSAYFTAYGITLGVSLGAFFVAGVVGGLIGWIPVLGQLVVLVIAICTAVFPSLVSAHLFGQFAAHPAGKPSPKKARTSGKKMKRLTKKTEKKSEKKSVKRPRKAGGPAQKKRKR